MNRGRGPRTRARSSLTQGRSSYSQALGALSYHPVWDIQSVGSGPERRLLVAFGSESGRPGVIGIYRGE